MLFCKSHLITTSFSFSETQPKMFSNNINQSMCSHLALTTPYWVSEHILRSAAPHRVSYWKKGQTKDKMEGPSTPFEKHSWKPESVLTRAATVRYLKRYKWNLDPLQKIKTTRCQPFSKRWPWLKPSSTSKPRYRLSQNSLGMWLGNFPSSNP